MTDELLVRLRKIRREFESILRREGIIGNGEGKERSKLVLTKEDMSAWQKNEPNYTKRIARPLTRKRKGQLMLAFLFLSLTMPRLVVPANRPNELPHAHLPNEDDALPYVR